MQDQPIITSGKQEVSPANNADLWLQETNALAPGGKHLNRTVATGEALPAPAHSPHQPASPEGQVQSALPSLSIDEKGSGNDAGFASSLAHSFAYSLLQSPVDGLSQVYDHTIGSTYGSNLSGHTKDLLVSTPQQARFGSPAWHGQSIGGALGAIPWFLAARGAVRGTAGAFAMTSALAVDSAEALAGGGLLSSTGAKLTLEGGLTGAAYSAFLKPVNTNDDSFGLAKLKSVATDFTTFSTMTATSLALSAKLGALALPMVQKAPGAAPLIERTSAMLAGGLSGVPGAFVDTGAQYLLADEKHKPGMADLGKNLYSFTIIGAGMSATMHAGGKPEAVTPAVHKAVMPAVHEAVMPAVEEARSEAAGVDNITLPESTAAVTITRSTTPVEVTPITGKHTQAQSLAALENPNATMPAADRADFVHKLTLIADHEPGHIAASPKTPENIAIPGVKLHDDSGLLDDYMKHYAVYLKHEPAGSKYFNVSQNQWLTKTLPDKALYLGDTMPNDYDFKVANPNIPGLSLGSKNYPHSSIKHLEKLVPKLDPWEEPERESKHDIVSIADSVMGLESMPSAADYKYILGDRVVGELPKPLLNTGLDADQVLTKLDGLARAMRSLDTVLPPQKKSGLGAQDLHMPPFEIALGDKTVNVSKAGIGEVAHVYKLSIDGQDYAFKVPNDPARMDVHGAYAESGAFAFLSNKKVSDLIDFHAARPSAEGGWMLIEFVSKPVQREGEPLTKILSDMGLHLGDDWFANRGPGNVVWDLGGIEPKGVKPPTSYHEFQALLSTGDGKIIGGRKLNGITDQAELKLALLGCLQYEALGGQVARTAALRLKNPADLHDVLNQALDTEGAAGRAAFELDKLAGTPYIKDLFYKALYNPESRVEVAKMIDKLPLEERTGAFNAAIAFPECRAMAARSIPSLPAADRAAAIEQALEYPGSRFVIYQQRLNDGDVSAETKEESSKALHQYLQSYGIESGERTAGNQITAEQWLASPEANPHGETLAPHLIENAAQIWPHLTDAQKGMSAESLVQLANNWYKLEPEQWIAMTPKEVSEHLAIVDQFLLDSVEARELLEIPDMKPWLRNNWNIAPYEMTSIMANWKDFTPALKQLPVAELTQVSETWNRFNQRSLQRLSTADVVEVAKAILDLSRHSPNLHGIENNPSFARWYNKHSAEFASPDKYAMSHVLQVWDKLGAHFESLPADKVVPEMFKQHNIGILNDFGTSSAVRAYLETMDATGSTTLSSASAWVKSLEETKGSYQSSGKALLEALVKEQAPADQFTQVALQTRLDLETHFGAHPQLRARLEQVFSDPAKAADFAKFIGNYARMQSDNNRLVALVDKSPPLPSPTTQRKTAVDGIPDGTAHYNLLQQQTKRLVEIALDNGFKGTEKDLTRLSSAQRLSKRALWDDAVLDHIYKLSRNTKLLNQLDHYAITKSTDQWETVKRLLENQADWTQLNVKRLNDNVALTKLNAFDQSEKGQLKVLQKNGLSIDRLQNYLADKPHGLDAVKDLLAKGADARQVINLMRLAVYPEKVALRLVEADAAGKISAEDVIGKTRDWESGRTFSKFLSRRAKSSQELSQETIDTLFKRASAITSGTAVIAPPKTVDLSSTSPVKGAKAFVEAADGVLKTVPADKPIVLLGRDTWPLVPLLRAHGRDAQYFMWSRLQNSDQNTRAQWRKEVPPGAAVIDSGFSGSIIDRIKAIDPKVEGYLMSSSNSIYPTLINSPKHHTMVTEIESLPKLIPRSHTHRESGAAIARKALGANDIDHALASDVRSRWNVELQTRELLRATGLSNWDVWRYSQFVGLTPQERLGLNSTEKVERHYNKIADLREQRKLERDRKLTQNSGNLAPVSGES